MHEEIFSRKWSLWGNGHFIRHFLVIFACRIIPYLLFTYTQSVISFVQVYVMNFRTQFPRRRSVVWKNLTLYFLLTFSQGDASYPLVRVIWPHPVYIYIYYILQQSYIIRWFIKITRTCCLFCSQQYYNVFWHNRLYRNNK